MTGLDPTGADQAAPGAAGDEGNSKTTNLYCSALGFTNFTDDDHELLLTNSDDRTGGTNLVQIARTFGNCRGLAGQHITHAGTFTDPNGYSHAPTATSPSRVPSSGRSGAPSGSSTSRTNTSGT